MRAPLPRATSRNGKRSLRNISILGLVLVALGTGGLRQGGLHYHNWVPAVNAGPIHLEAHMDRRISLPTAGGFLMLLTGIGFIAIRWRKA